MENSKNKTHYRKVFKSDHLGVADLEDFLEQKQRLVFTIREVKQEYNVSVAGRKGNHNIAYFNDTIKPLVLNATNSKVLKKFTNSAFVEDWKNLQIELYIDYSVKMKGDVVGGVRIKPTQPALIKEVLNEQNSKWTKAKEAIQEGNTSVESIRKTYELSDYDAKKLLA